MTLWRAAGGKAHSELSTVNEVSDHTAGEEHHARCVHSMKRQVLSCTSQWRRDRKKDEEAGVTAAATETEEASEEDVEIRRFFEEKKDTQGRGTVAKRSEQMLKKNVQRPKSKKTVRHLKSICRVQGVKNIPRIKSATKRILITERKNEKVESSRLEKGLPRSSENSTKFYGDNEQEESETRSQ